MSSKTSRFSKRVSGTTILLALLFVLGFFLRYYGLPTNLFFGPEHGIDFLVVRDIVLHHKLTLIGAKTDIAGVFHGPIYYYLSAIPFFFSHGSPLVVEAFLIVLHLLAIILLYWLGTELFHRRVGVIAAIIYTLSFGAIVYSRWLSTHPLAFPFSVLYFLFLVRFLRGKQLSLPLAGIAFGFFAQTEFLNIPFYLLVTFCIVVAFFKDFKKQPFWLLGISVITLTIFTFGNYFLFDLRHQWLISKNLLLLGSGHTGYHIGFAKAITTTLLTFIESFSFFVFPTVALFGGVLLLGSIYAIFRQAKFDRVALVVIFWLIIPPLVLMLLHHDVLTQYFVASAGAFIIAVSFFIDSLWSRSPAYASSLLVVLVLVNIFVWFRNIPQNNNIFFQSTQPDLKYADELQVIDTIYTKAYGKPFSFQSYTIPYWTQQAWQYLFWQYGQRKYGYGPTDNHDKTLFVIIQDDQSNKTFQSDWLKYTVSHWGKTIYQKRIGVLTVQELQVP